MVQDSGQAGAEIEVTPEMVDAGSAVMLNSGIADDYLEADKDTVIAVYRAMVAQAVGHSKPC